MTYLQYIRKHVFAILDVVKFLLLLLLAITFINFNIQLSRQTKAIYDLGLQQKSTATSIQKNTTQQLDKLNDHVDCIFHYFATPNRADTVITDVNLCSIVPLR